MTFVGHPLRATSPLAPADARITLVFGWKDVAVALLGAMTCIEFNVGGRLFFPEIALLVILAFAAMSNRLGINKIHASLVGFMALWLIGLVITDITKGTIPDDFLRGWARIIFLLTNFIGLSVLLTDRWSLLFSFMGGFASSGIIAYIFFPSDYALSFPFKFGYGPSLAIFAVLLSWYIRGRLPLWPGISLIPVLLVGFESILEGARSQGLILMLCAAMTYTKSRLFSVQLPLLRAVILVAASVAGFAIVYSLYSTLAGSGYLGEAERDKYLLESSGDWGLISGRAEIFSSLRAIRDAPIIGHGSWAKNAEYVLYLQDVLASFGIAQAYIDEANDIIPTHSHLFGSWVEAGVAGAIFWVYILLLIYRCLRRQLLVESTVDVLVLYVITLLCWDILFSPFGAERRLSVAFDLVVLSSYLAEPIHRKLWSSRLVRAPLPPE